MNRWGGISVLRRLSMIGIPILFPVLVIGVVGAFYSPVNTSAAQATPAEPNFTSVITVAISSELEHLDPALAQDFVNTFFVSAQIYDTLIGYQPGTTAITPSLAISWTVSPDGLTWDFYIRPGVKFHDGTDANASAVLFNLERWWDPANPYHNGSFDYFGGLFSGFKGDPNCLITDMSSNGDRQLTLQLSRPYSPLPAALTNPAFAIASPAAIQAGTLMTNPVGSGPFRLGSWVMTDSLRLEAYPDYWAGEPNLAGVQIQVIPDESARYAALKSGSVQMITQISDSGLIADAFTDPALQLRWRDSSNVGYLGMNRNHGDLADSIVRLAIAHAIDRAALIHQYYAPGDLAASQFLPPVFWGRDPNLVDYSYNPSLAQQLLASAGYTQGVTTTLAYRNVTRGYLPNPADTVIAIQAELQAVGIHAAVIEYDSPTFIQKFQDGELDLFLIGWGADFLHPDNFFYPVLCQGYQLAFGDRDDDLCASLDTAQASTDDAEQLALYQAASRRIHDTLPLLPLAHGQSALLQRAEVAGIIPSVMGFESLKDAHFAGASQIIVDPSSDSTLVYTSTQGLTTTVEVPAGAVSDNTLLRFTPVQTATVPSGFIFAGNTFELEAIQNGFVQDGFVFVNPIQVTINYSDQDITGLDEADLMLYVLDDGRWKDAAQTCTPASVYERQPEINRLSLPICHLSQFAMAEQVTYYLHLPLMGR